VNKFERILNKYWGYKQFRPLQLEIIQSVYKNIDTLALMPTGGGKSITFQVSALSKDGICIVITPLIALMKDQVDNLRQKNIKAVAIYSGMSKREIQITIDNCIYGEIKFLYVSPERIATKLFQEKVLHMNVNLIAVDEAHCISQWGYDFRPSYLGISQLRELLPETPILAVTATATQDVITDIQQKLEFKKENVLSTSFERKNLTYIVKQKEDKLGFILNICNKVRGAGIIYVRTRKKTKEIAAALQSRGISADYYNAGLKAEIRQLKQERWMKSPNTVMVCTNAFGMGIDKPNVRFVLHFDIPESIEAYFQEAGRAGRDGKESFAVLLFNKTDIKNLKTSFVKKFPEITYIKRVYEALGSYYQLPIGAGKGNVYDYFIADICKTCKLDLIKTHNSIKVLEEEGYIYVSESAETRSRAKFKIERNDLYKFQVENQQFDIFIKLLLRNYTGIFTEYAQISEADLAKKVGATPELIRKYFIALARLNIISFYEAKQNPLIYYTEERVPFENIYISKQAYENRKERQKVRLDAIIHYISSQAKCRSLMLLDYFGETSKVRCGNCDSCRKRNEIGLSRIQFDKILDQIKKMLKEKSTAINEIVEKIQAREEDTLKVVNYLLDNKKINYTAGGKLIWTIP